MRYASKVLSLVAVVFFCGCGEHNNEALITSMGTVSVCRYRASRPVNRYRVEVDGKQHTSGRGALQSQDLELAVIEGENETTFHLRIGDDTHSFSVPSWEEPGGKSQDVRFHHRKSLEVDGPAQLYQLTEKSMDDRTKSRVVRLLVE